jgi:murein L,D-transpeptidase YafK
MKLGFKFKWPVITTIILLAVACFVLPFGPGQSADLAQVRKSVTPKLKLHLENKGLQLGQNIFIRIFKETSELEVWIKGGNAFELFKTYEICNFSGKLGPKLKEGDYQSPEGFYFVTSKQLNPNSSYHLSFNLGFPNTYDRANARTGSYLMVHGNCVSIGCYAMRDAGIEEIYLLAEAALKNGQAFFRVHAFPFRMTPESMERHKGSEWLDFWQNLKTGYDFFEEHRVPPNVTVVENKYRFGEIGDE